MLFMLSLANVVKLQEGVHHSISQTHWRCYLHRSCLLGTLQRQPLNTLVHMLLLEEISADPPGDCHQGVLRPLICKFGNRMQGSAFNARLLARLACPHLQDECKPIKLRNTFELHARISEAVPGLYTCGKDHTCGLFY